MIRAYKCKWIIMCEYTGQFLMEIILLGVLARTISAITASASATTAAAAAVSTAGATVSVIVF